MAAHQSASSNGATPVVEPAERPAEPATGSGAHVIEPVKLTTADRKARLADVLVAKTEQGYEIESQTDTEATLVTKGRRRWLGIGANAAETRQIISIDELGDTITRTD